MSPDSTLAVIPARGGSKGVPRKNIRELRGRPLIEYTIEAATRSDSVDRTVVTTDDREIADVAEAAGAEVPFMRPSSLAQDDTPTEPVVSHALEELDESFDAFVLLQPTSPLRTADHVDGAVERYRASGADSLVSVYEDHSYRWGRSDDGARQLNYGGERKRRQEKESEFVENGAIYMTDADLFARTESFTAGKTVLYEMGELVSVDIDTEVDLQMAATVMETRR